jgi:heme/copper-type cytochrome/quinol oxidase subunit 3
VNEKKMSTAIVELRPHAKDDAASYLGIVIALGSWAMMFGGIFFVYAAMRANASQWPPEGIPRLPITLPLVSSGVIAASSVTMQWALSAVKVNRVERFKKLLGATIVLGLVFLDLQWVLWSRVSAAGIHFETGQYGAIFYAFTMTHAAHIVAGLCALIWLMIRAFRGVYSAHNWFGVRSVAYFWHFVDVVWMLMFLSIFVF